MDQLKKNKTFLDSLSGKQLHLLGVIIYIGIAFYAFFDFLVFNKVYIYTDIGSDTFNAFWPRYVCVADYLREYGFPSWSFKQGMGQNILPDSIGDPFNWILYIAGRNYIPYAIGYVEVLKIILAGSFFLAFLRQLNRSNYVALMGSLCYAFSGFMIVGSGWYIFSTGGVLFALLLLSSEYVFQHKNTWLFPITICILGCANPFNWYTFGIVLWLYLTIRYFSIESKGLKGYVQLLQRFLFLAILGIGISAIISFSTIIEMLESPRVAGDAGLFSDLKQRGILYLETANYYATVVLSFFSSDLQGTGSSFRGWSNYLEAPSFYCGLISLLLASQMLIFRKNEANYLLLLFAGLVLIPAFIPFFRYVVWGFSGDYFRGYAFWVILAIIFLSTKSLEDILKKGSLNIPFLFSVLLICTVILAIPVDNYPASGNLRFYLIIGLICYASLIFLLRIPQYSYHAQIVLLFLLSIELATASKITTSDRIALERSELDKKTAYNDYTIEAVEYLKIIDPGFYRIEKAYSSGAPNILSFNDAQIQNFYGTSSYYSFNHPAYIRFLDKMGVIDGQNEYQTRWSVGLKNSPLLQTYASTKYLLFKSGTIRDISGYHRKKMVGDVEIWENNHFLPFGFTCNMVISESSLMELDAPQKSKSIMQAVVIEDREKDTFKDLNKFDPETIPVNYTLDLLAKDISKLKVDTFQFTTFSEHKLAGTLLLQEEKVLILTIPFDKGWKATVNGERMNIHKINFGLSGLLLKPGDYQIVIEYEPRFFLLSVAISVLSLLLLFFLHSRFYIRKF